MKNSIQNLVLHYFLALLLLSLAGCKDDFTVTHGDIAGIVRPEGVKITFDRGDKKFSTVSGANTQFIMHDLETGTYNIIFEKKDYFTYKMFGFTFLGGPSCVSLPIQYLSPVPQGVKFSLDSVSSHESGTLELFGSYSMDQIGTDGSFWTRWFISGKPGVSSSQFLQTTYCWAYVTNDLYHIYIDVDYDLINNIPAVYIKGYPSGSFSDYFDWDKNVDVYSIGKESTAEYRFEIPNDFYTD